MSAIQENSSYGLTGKGILISVIDSGIDYAHPDFCNPDKTTRLVALWDQTILADPSAGRFAPAGYSQGTLFSPEQINAALQADTFEQRRNNLKEKLSWTFDIYYLWKGGK